MTPERIEILFKQNYSDFIGLAFNILKSEPEAEDVVSDAFLKLTQFEGGNNGQAKTFLMTTIKNDCLNILKHNRRAARHHGVMIESLPDYVQAQEVRSEVVSIIIREINKLPVAQRLVFKMRYIDEMSRRDICKALKIQLGTFDTHMMRAKQRIRSVFKDKV